MVTDEADRLSSPLSTSEEVWRKVWRGRDALQPMSSSEVWLPCPETSSLVPVSVVLGFLASSLPRSCRLCCIGAELVSLLSVSEIGKPGSPQCFLPSRMSAVLPGLVLASLFSVPDSPDRGVLFFCLSLPLIGFPDTGVVSLVPVSDVVLDLTPSLSLVSLSGSQVLLICFNVLDVKHTGG